MKLLFCPACQDVIRLFAEPRQCKCGQTSGHYINDIEAVFTGGIPLGFNNTSFVTALNNQPTHGLGYRFEAFVIPTNCRSFCKI